MGSCQPAGARLCAANKSHGDADGGRTGFLDPVRPPSASQSYERSALGVQHLGAELQEVYFFHEMKGKIESFVMAAAEHLRREQSQEFQRAVSAGLEELSMKKCGDGSQYSREEHRGK